MTPEKNSYLQHIIWDEMKKYDEQKSAKETRPAYSTSELLNADDSRIRFEIQLLV